MALASVALSTARALLNDPSATLWTDTILLPFLQEAYRELQVQVALSGIPVTNEVATVLSVATGATNLSNVAGFPTATFVEPIQLFERYPGETDSNFIEIDEKTFIPNQDKGDRLSVWAFVAGLVQVLGANRATEVKMRYTQSLNPLTSAGSVISLIFGENYLGHRTASLAASSVGNTTGHDEWKDEADAKIENVVRMNVKGQQAVGVRRRAYHRRNFREAREL